MYNVFIANKETWNFKDIFWKYTKTTFFAK